MNKKAYTKGFIQGYHNLVNKNNDIREFLYKVSACIDAKMILKKTGALTDYAIPVLTGGAAGALGSALAGGGAGSNLLGAGAGALGGAAIKGISDMFSEEEEDQENAEESAALSAAFASQAQKEKIDAMASMLQPSYASPYEMSDEDMYNLYGASPSMFV